jgi:segregation and condensation protein A
VSLVVTPERSPGNGRAVAPERSGDLPSVRFNVRLDNFSGPFDLLLQLINRHELDVTEVALHQVTDDFIAHTRALAASGADADLDEITEFLVIAATLLDLKAARLLPGADVEDVEDLALLEARDLLFARLLQYRAYKQVAALFVELEASAQHRYPRSVSLEPRYAEMLPEVMLGMDARRFAELAAALFRPKPPPTVSLDHLHKGTVSVPEHMAVLRERLLELGRASFHQLTADCDQPIEVVARFLAVLELYREASVLLDQDEAFGELMVSWVPSKEAA